MATFAYSPSPRPSLLFPSLKNLKQLAHHSLFGPAISERKRRQTGFSGSPLPLAHSPCSTQSHTTLGLLLGPSFPAQHPVGWTRGTHHRSPVQRAALGEVDGRVPWCPQQQESGGLRPEVSGHAAPWAWGLGRAKNRDGNSLSAFFQAKP